MYTVLGGSFSRLHKGHKLMIKAAFETGNKVIVGLSSDNYLKHNKAYRDYPYSRRRKALDSYMSKLGGEYEILPLESSSGNTTTNPDYGVIVVSRETEGVADSINVKRRENGLKALEIISVPILMAEDLFPLSSTRIIEKEISPSGSRITSIRIGVATNNDLKVDTVKEYFRKVMKNLIVEKVSEYTLDSEQPFGEDTVRFATRRAMEALSDRDYGIGIESGVWRNPSNGKYIEKHVCVVIDRYSRVTTGTSSGFELPENIVSHMKEGMDESAAFETMYGKSEIGKRGGVIGEFSQGKLLRSDLIFEALRNSFVPRFGPSYFDLDSKF